jgi:hypothetical protein
MENWRSLRSGEKTGWISRFTLADSSKNALEFA